MAELDASIYGNMQVPKVNMPNPLDMQEKTMSMGLMGVRGNQILYDVMNQRAVMDSGRKAIDPQTGRINRGQFLRNLSQSSPAMAMEAEKFYNQQDKMESDALAAKMEAAHKVLSVATPTVEYLLSLPDAQARAAFPNVVAQLKEQGVPTNSVPMLNGVPVWDRAWAKQTYAIGSRMKEGLENQMRAMSIQKMPYEMQKLMYGSGSPNAVLTGNYNDQVKPLRQSQIFMNRFLENYMNPTPAGDASLVLDAFKMKYPNAPDVNSLHEIATSQSIPDRWRQWAAHALEGGIGEEGRRNIMKDVGPAYLANMETLQAIQHQTRMRQQYQGVNDPTVTFEPAMDITAQKVRGILEDIGPYVPPTQRGGVTGAVTNFLGKMAGIGGQKTMAEEAPDNRVPPGMILMQDPQGEYRLIPKEMKREAIAAGGKVVKE